MSIANLQQKLWMQTSTNNIELYNKQHKYPENETSDIINSIQTWVCENFRPTIVH